MAVDQRFFKLLLGIYILPALQQFRARPSLIPRIDRLTASGQSQRDANDQAILRRHVLILGSILLQKPLRWAFADAGYCLISVGFYTP